MIFLIWEHEIGNPLAAFIKDPKTEKIAELRFAQS